MSQLRKHRRAWRALFAENDDSLMRELKGIAWRISRRDESVAKDLVQEALHGIWMHMGKIMRADKPRQTAIHAGRLRMKKHMQRFVLRRYGIVHHGDRDVFVDRVDWDMWTDRMENCAPGVIEREVATSPSVQINRSLIERTLRRHIFGDEQGRAA